MKILTREDILNAQDSKLVPLDVPEWGGTIYIRSLSASERDAWEKSNTVKRKGKSDVKWDDFRGRFLVLVICDASGNRLFSDADASAFGRRNAGIVEPVFDFAREVSGISKKDADDLEAEESALTQANGNGNGAKG